MMTCWEAQPEKRPLFTDLVQTLSSKLVVMAEYMDLSPSSTTGLINPQNGNIHVHHYNETSV